MVWSKSGFHGKFTTQQMIIMSNREQEEKRRKREAEKKLEQISSIAGGIHTNMQFILDIFDEIENLTNEYEKASPTDSDNIKQKLKIKFNEVKGFLQQEYKKYDDNDDKDISAFYYPAIRDAYLELSGFGSNRIAKKNISELRGLLYSAGSQVRYWKNQLHN
ncbi:hypothetical protein [Brevibacillus agri]|uniref:hypothetical protein n=1 Tax=Brevibacillus agri TaxID=51101 RepID=UPI003D20A450